MGLGERVRRRERGKEIEDGEWKLKKQEVWAEGKRRRGSRWGPVVVGVKRRKK